MITDYFSPLLFTVQWINKDLLCYVPVSLYSVFTITSSGYNMNSIIL